MRDQHVCQVISDYEDSVINPDRYPIQLRYESWQLKSLMDIAYKKLVEEVKDIRKLLALNEKHCLVLASKNTKHNAVTRRKA